MLFLANIYDSSKLALIMFFFFLRETSLLILKAITSDTTNWGHQLTREVQVQRNKDYKKEMSELDMAIGE